MIKIDIKLSLILLISVNLNACTVGPNYVKPTQLFPKTWQNGKNFSSKIEVQSLANWWMVFHDAQLSQLIRRSIDNNFDLKQAIARINEAKAQRGVAYADYFPKINGSSSVGESYNGNNNLRTGRYALGLDSRWEIDLFGRIARSVESANANIEANQAAYQQIMVSLIAEVATNYVQMRTFQARLQIAEQNLHTQHQIYQLALWRWQTGLATQLDSAQALITVKQLKAQIPTLKTQIVQTQHQLALLLGLFPTQLYSELQIIRPIPIAPFSIAIGIPADILHQRPDVKQAERQLAAQTAQIGIATAEIYPKFSFTGSIGLETIYFSQLFTPAGLVDNLLGKLTFPIFNAQQIRQNIAVQTAKQQQALANYETTVLTALKEVENALIALAQEQQRFQELAAAEQSAKQAVQLAKEQYIAGLIDFQNVQQMQRNWLNVQDQYQQSQGQLSNDLIYLYKTLGGGWKPLKTS
jgi:NodT family efflux transporter outer membrane factor (OMF) lipoprotein